MQNKNHNITHYNNRAHQAVAKSIIYDVLEKY